MPHHYKDLRERTTDDLIPRNDLGRSFNEQIRAYTALSNGEYNRKRYGSRLESNIVRHGGLYNELIAEDVGLDATRRHRSLLRHRVAGITANTRKRDRPELFEDFKGRGRALGGGIGEALEKEVARTGSYEGFVGYQESPGIPRYLEKAAEVRTLEHQRAGREEAIKRPQEIKELIDLTKRARAADRQVYEHRVATGRRLRAQNEEYARLRRGVNMAERRAIDTAAPYREKESNIKREIRMLAPYLKLPGNIERTNALREELSKTESRRQEVVEPLWQEYRERNRESRVLRRRQNRYESEIYPEQARIRTEGKLRRYRERER